MIVNGAWIEEDRELDPSLLAEIGAIFSKLGHDFSLYLPVGFSQAESSLLRSGYLKRIVFPTLLLDPPLPSKRSELDPKLALECVQNPNAQVEFIALCAECFEFSAQTAGLCRALLADWTLGPDRQVILLRLEGTVVAAAMVLIVQGYAVIDWVATRPVYRRQGFGALVTKAALRTGFDQGAEAAVLHASDAGLGLYRRLGFREVGAIALHAPATRSNGKPQP